VRIWNHRIIAGCVGSAAPCPERRGKDPGLCRLPWRGRQAGRQDHPYHLGTTGYIYIQLRDFKRGDRKSEIMQPIVSSLERDDMLAIADYFSKKPWPDLGQPRAPKDVAERAQSANTSVGCTGCHLDRFQGDGTVPRLAGMGRDYLTKTIADFRTRARGNNPGMSDLMLATSPDDLAALAEYLSGL
jgi:cytochrome c553